MNEEQKYFYEKVLNSFDRDIRENNSLLSKIEKQLYKLSIDLTIDDWKIIRGKDYFTYTKNMGIQDKRLHLLERIKFYLKNR
jgi:predicted nuclease of restriction endonuclease-like RecB superfamily